MVTENKLYNQSPLSLSSSRTSMNTIFQKIFVPNPRGIFWNDRDKTHRAADGTDSAAALTLHYAHAWTEEVLAEKEF